MNKAKFDLSILGFCIGYDPSEDMLQQNIREQQMEEQQQQQQMEEQQQQQQREEQR
jgi:hypothetical protein